MKAKRYAKSYAKHFKKKYGRMSKKQFNDWLNA